MHYQSTRNNKITATPAEAILNGLAPDGGLYVPSTMGFDFDLQAALELDKEGERTLSIAKTVLCALLPDFGEEEMEQIVSAAYKNKFETEELTPTVKVGDKYVLELFRGPTSAFKDVALSVLPHLMGAAKKKCGIDDEILILTATSGDTGKAALEGFCNVEGTSIAVFYPHGGVSAVQKAQMVTQQGKNVRVAAIKGNFDDAQSAVKTVFTGFAGDCAAPRGIRLSSANSINIGRLAPQVVYYFTAYRHLVKTGAVKLGDKVDYVVPTGNFGDILAGYFAKRMGLPVGKLVCASNENHVLTDFINTGRYDKRRQFRLTASPSMDILLSSNLERLLYMLCEDTALTADLMAKLKEQGYYDVPGEMHEKIKELFFAGWCDDAATKKTIGEVWQNHGYLMDTHTAVAMNVAERYCAAQGAKKPVVVLSTASPYKFPKAVLEGINGTTQGDEFDLMERLNELSGVPVPKNLSGLKQRKVLHGDVIEKGAITDYVRKMAESLAQ